MTRLSDLPDRTLERLSAYLDGELSPRDAARLESALRADAELRSALEEVRAVTRLMATLPPKRAPRNFTLRPSMLGRRPARLIYPRLQLATALATLVFLMTFGVDLLAGGAPLARQASVGAEAPVPLAAAAEMGALAADASKEATASAPAPQFQEQPTQAAFAEVLPSLMLESATEAPAAEEPLLATGMTTDGGLGTEAGAAPTLTCEDSAVGACALESAPEEAQAPALSLMVPEADSPTPEAQARVEKAATEPPPLAQVAPGAASLPTEALSHASEPAPLPGFPPAPAEAQLANQAADALSGEEMETPAIAPAERFEEPEAGVRLAWLTPLRVLQVGLALLTLLLASLTIWARQQP